MAQGEGVQEEWAGIKGDDSRATERSRYGSREAPGMGQEASVCREGELGKLHGSRGNVDSAV